MIHIAFALHDYLGNYCMYTASAIASVLENSAEDITIHLLHDDTLRLENRERLGELCRAYSQTIVFYNIRVQDDFDVRAIEERGYTVGCMFRLYMAQLLPFEVERVIYLDSDLIVNLDILELWDLPIEGRSLAAVVDEHLPTEPVYSQVIRDVLGIPPEKYFNSGVVIMDMARIRQGPDLLKECREYLQGNSVFFPDQDLLNVLFQGDVCYIDRKFNSFMVKNENRPIERRIYHYNGDIYDYANQMLMFKELYYHYADKTPWHNPDLDLSGQYRLLHRMHSALPVLQSRRDQGTPFSSRDEWHYAMELHRAGEYEEARDFLLACCGENQSPAHLALKLFWLAACYEALGCPGQQKEALLHSLCYDAPGFAVCSKLGEIFMKEKQYRSARPWLETALRTVDHLPAGDVGTERFRICQKLCKCCFQMNDIQAAMDYNEKAAEIRPESPSAAMNREYFGSLARPDK